MSQEKDHDHGLTSCHLPQNHLPHDHLTQSLCPHCLKKISATRVQKGDSVYLVKECPEHGPMQTLIWQGEPSMSNWVRNKTKAGPKLHATQTEKGCPFDCGICPQHRQKTCTALIEITHRCNLNCPVCFADSKENPADLFSGDSQNDPQTHMKDPSLEEIKGWYKRIKEITGGQCNIQISGGEPTVRDDLPEIVRMGKEMGFGFIQLNTNGLLLAYDEALLPRLKQAGLSSVFLQFDGVDDRVHLELRGKKLQSVKERAIDICQAENIGVVLVPTLVPGVNDSQVGEIIRFGIRRSPQVRGVHFQPISYFGRFPNPREEKPRITLPHVIQHIQAQTGIDGAHFRPPG
ncbi:MAG: radical SAM protein [Desulfobacterium sp.]|nr:radical SAM protein [Desulfobacterium sp.]